MTDPERRFVPFERLWKMRIDVPYSLMVRDRDRAWSCGQIALDANSQVLHADALRTQSAVTADYVAQLLRHVDLDDEHLKRLVLYYVPAGDNSDGDRVEQMQSVFRDMFNDRVLLDPVAVPHFYYDGIVLEVDAFAGPIVDDQIEWISIEVPAADLPDAIDEISAADLLSAHWFVPTSSSHICAAEIEQRGLIHDAGFVVEVGDHTDLVRGSLTRSLTATVDERSATAGDVQITRRQVDGLGWISARSTNSAAGLVAQTEQIMDGLAAALLHEGLDFSAVVKSTTLYVGGSSEAELHDNMSVRNRRYVQPGPASTGVPVFGFADSASHVTVDLTYRP